MLWEVAYAQSQAPQGPSFVEQLIPFIAIFAIFYFLIIRPQSRRHREHQSLISGLKRGDQVITTGGIYGTIEGITDKFVTLEVAEGVQIRILKNQIASSAVEGKPNA